MFNKFLIGLPGGSEWILIVLAVLICQAVAGALVAIILFFLLRNKSR